MDKFPEAQPAESLDEVINEPSINLVACAAVPRDRGEIGVKAMLAGKDFFADKPPFVSMEQLKECREVSQNTGRKFFVYFSERLHVEAAVCAGKLIQEGAVGRVIHMDGFGPHRHSPELRPAWFYDKSAYGGIICDIGSSNRAIPVLHRTKSAKVTFLARQTTIIRSTRNLRTMAKWCLPGTMAQPAIFAWTVHS